jgi:hypothetical protein
VLVLTSVPMLGIAVINAGAKRQYSALHWILCFLLMLQLCDIQWGDLVGGEGWKRFVANMIMLIEKSVEVWYRG